MRQLPAKQSISNHPRTKLAIESLERRDVPAIIPFSFAGEAILEIKANEVALLVTGNPNSEIRSYNPGDEIIIGSGTGNDTLTILNLLGTSPELTIQYLGSEGVDTLALSGNPYEINLVASESNAGGAFVEAFRLLSSPDDLLPIVDSNLRITADSIELVIGSPQSDIFNISGTVAASILGSLSPQPGTLDLLVFSNDSRLVETLNSQGTIGGDAPIFLDFGSYTTRINADYSSGLLAVTNANDEPIYQGNTRVGSVLGSAANDRFIFSGFSIPTGEETLSVSLFGGEGDDEFILVDSPSIDAEAINFAINGGTQAITGTPTNGQRGDILRVDSAAVSNVFNLAAYDPDSPLPLYPGLLTSIIAESAIVIVPFAGIESFIGGSGNDNFISPISKLGSPGNLFQGNGGSDFYATWNQSTDLLIVDSDDFLTSIDQTRDTVLGDAIPRPSANPRRAGLATDLFFTEQKRSIVDNDRVITPENQHQVYTAYIFSLFLDLLGRSPTTGDLNKWVFEVIETRRLGSQDVVREFVLGNVGNLIVRDFYLAFFSGNFSDQISLANPTEAAAQAEQGLGLKAASIANGIVFSDQNFVDLVLGELFVDEPFFSFITESTTLLRQRALNVLSAGGTWEDAIITIVNSEEYLRVAVRSIATIDSSFRDIIAPLPESSIVNSAVPMLSLFRDGQWKVDADQLSLDVRFETQIQFGVAIDRPVLGDWNGDGLPDLGVYRDGVWYLDTNGIVGWQGDDTIVNFGVQIDTPVVGDWNGDGIDDLGVFRRGTWYLDTNGTRGWQGNDSFADFGVAIDKPVAADWNGDKRSDLGVIRNGNTFYADVNGFRGWQGNDSTVILSKSILQPVGGDFNFNGFGDISQFGAPGTELTAFDFANVGPTALPLQANIAPGETPVAWSRGGRPLSPSNSQYESLIPAPLAAGTLTAFVNLGATEATNLDLDTAFLDLALAAASLNFHPTNHSTEAIPPGAIDDALDEELLTLDP